MTWWCMGTLYEVHLYQKHPTYFFGSDDSFVVQRTIGKFQWDGNLIVDDLQRYDNYYQTRTEYDINSDAWLYVTGIGI